MHSREKPDYIYTAKGNTKQQISNFRNSFENAQWRKAKLHQTADDENSPQHTIECTEPSSQSAGTLKRNMFLIEDTF